MALSTSMYGKMLPNLLGGETSGESSYVDYLSDTIKLALTTSSYAADFDVDEFFSDVTNELSTANGYTSGGYTLASKTISYNATGNDTKFSSAAVAIAASGGSLVWRYGVIYKSTGTGSTSMLLCRVDFGATQTLTDGITFTLTPDATNGWFHGTAV